MANIAERDFLYKLPGRLSEESRNEELEKFRDKSRVMSNKTKVIIATNVLTLCIGIVLFILGLTSSPKTTSIILKDYTETENETIADNDKRIEYRRKYADALTQYLLGLDVSYKSTSFSGRKMVLNEDLATSQTETVLVFDPKIWVRHSTYPSNVTPFTFTLGFDSSQPEYELSESQLIALVQSTNNSSIFYEDMYIEDSSDPSGTFYWKVKEKKAIFKPHSKDKVMLATLGLFSICTITSSIIGVAINRVFKLTDSSKAWIQFLVSFSITPLVNHYLNSTIVEHVRIDHYTVQRYIITSLFDVMVSWALTDIILTSYLSKTSKLFATDSYWVVSLVSLVTYLCNSGIMRDQYVSPQGPSLFSDTARPPMTFSSVAISANAIVAEFLAQATMSTSATEDKKVRLFIVVFMLSVMSVGFVLDLNEPGKTHPHVAEMTGIIYLLSLAVLSIIGIAYFIYTGKKVEKMVVKKRKEI